MINLVTLLHQIIFLNVINQNFLHSPDNREFLVSCFCMVPASPRSFSLKAAGLLRAPQALPALCHPSQRSEQARAQGAETPRVATFQQ